MSQLLPAIVALWRLPAAAVVPFAAASAEAGIIVPVLTARLQPVPLVGDGELQAVRNSEGEKLTLSFTTTDVLPPTEPLAFVLRDAQGRHFLIGQRERPFLAVEQNRHITPERSAVEVKVSLTAPHALIPCAAPTH